MQPVMARSTMLAGAHYVELEARSHASGVMEFPPLVCVMCDDNQEALRLIEAGEVLAFIDGARDGIRCRLWSPAWGQPPYYSTLKVKQSIRFVITAPPELEGTAILEVNGMFYDSAELAAIGVEV